MAASDPDRPPLDAAALGRLPGWRVEVLDSTGSTNQVVSERARAGEPEGLVVVAEHQTGGRGRLDRAWVSPPRAGLTFSVLLTPSDTRPESWGWLPLLAGVAVAGGVRRASGVRCVLKWPNDVLVGERKVAGILAERVDTDSGPAAVVGIGLNVTTTAEELPVAGATSLGHEGAAPDRGAILGSVLNELATAYSTWRRAGPPAYDGVRDAYCDLCSTLDREVEVRLPGGKTLTGLAEGVDESGSLLVAGRRVSAGDVLHVGRA